MGDRPPKADFDTTDVAMIAATEIPSTRSIILRGVKRGQRVVIWGYGTILFQVGATTCTVRLRRTNSVGAIVGEASAYNVVASGRSQFSKMAIENAFQDDPEYVVTFTSAVGNATLEEWGLEGDVLA